MKYLTKDINLSDKTVLIMGLGLNGGGVGTAKFLAPKVKKLIITDLKSKEELQDSIDQLKEFSNIEYKLNGHDINDFINVDIVFKGAGIKFTNQYIKAAIDNNVIVDTDIGYFFELADFPIIGITGSKGKSTTTTLIYEILKTTIKDIILGGNITINPLTSINENNNTKLAVLELSSWQLSDLSIHKKSPNISILTTIFPDHLNYYSSMEEYYGDKKYIFKFQKSDDYTIINIDNDYLYNSFINGEIKSNLIFVSNFDENFNIDKIDRIKKISINKIPFFIIKYKNYLYLFKNKSFFSISDIEKYRNINNESGLNILVDNSNFEFFILPSIENTRLQGEHNKTNIALSICASLLNRISIENIYNTINNFSGPDFRLQKIRELNNITFINDTTATVPDAVAASINAVKSQAIKNKGRIILIAGGVDKKLPIDNMAKAIYENVEKLYLLDGSGSNMLKEMLIKMGYKSIEDGWKDLKQLVKKAYQDSKENDIILLSPGFASFNLFVNEFERGKIFNSAVLSLE